jgi:hypothetical protein
MQRVCLRDKTPPPVLYSAMATELLQDELTRQNYYLSQ